MLIARALLAKVRPPRLTPREIQDQVDVTCAAVLTAAYAVGRQEESAHGDDTYPYEKLEKEIAALRPPARKLRVQTAINDQVSANSAALAFVSGLWVPLGPRVGTTWCTSRDPVRSCWPLSTSKCMNVNLLMLLMCCIEAYKCCCSHAYSSIALL